MKRLFICLSIILLTYISHSKPNKNLETEYHIDSIIGNESNYYIYSDIIHWSTYDSNQDLTILFNNKDNGFNTDYPFYTKTDSSITLTKSDNPLPNNYYTIYHDTDTIAFIKNGEQIIDDLKWENNIPNQPDTLNIITGFQINDHIINFTIGNNSYQLTNEQIDKYSGEMNIYINDNLMSTQDLNTPFSLNGIPMSTGDEIYIELVDFRFKNDWSGFVISDTPLKTPTAIIDMIDLSFSSNRGTIEIENQEINWTVPCLNLLYYNTLNAQTSKPIEYNFIENKLNTTKTSNSITITSDQNIDDTEYYFHINNSNYKINYIFDIVEITGIDFIENEHFLKDTFRVCTEYSSEVVWFYISSNSNLQPTFKATAFLNDIKVDTFSNQTTFEYSNLKENDKIYLEIYEINYNTTCNISTPPDTLKTRTLTVKKIENIRTNYSEILEKDNAICPGEEIILDDTLTITSPGNYSFYNYIEGCRVITPDFSILADTNCNMGLISGYIINRQNRSNNSGIIISTNTGLATVSDDNGYYEFHFNTNQTPSHVFISNKDYYPDTTTINFRDPEFLSSSYNYLYTYLLEDSDLAVHLSSGRNRPGFIMPYYVTIENRGKNELTTEVNLTLDQNLNYISLEGEDTPDLLNGNTISWSDLTLASGESQRYTIYATLDRLTSLGTMLESIVSLDMIVTDDVLTNNIDTLISEVTGSYDPNDKLASPQGGFTEGYVYDTTDFEYTIRFQNTGTDTAFTVRVEDIIDTEVLDLTSIKMIDASHDYIMSISGDIVTWTFNNILLLDSTSNEPLSHGFIRFHINQKEGNLQGTVIANQAAIFFDFNDPIITNETMNIVDNEIVTSIEEKQAKSIGKLNTYPNPVTDILNIQLSEEASFSLYNQLGERVFQSETIENLDLSDIETGVYFYQVQTSDRNYSGKILKKGN